MASAFAHELAHLAAPDEAETAVPESRWTTANAVVLDLPTMRLRDFSAGAKGAACLVCAPFALHCANITDFATGHSLVEALRANGLARLRVTDWRSATPEMRFMSIDSYLADLNVAVDELGGKADLVGLCQGGWLALAYAARFPAKVRKLVLAGAPVDIAAGRSALSTLAADVPLSVFDALVEFGRGRMLGSRLLEQFGLRPPDADAIGRTLQLAAVRIYRRPARHLLSSGGRMAVQAEPARRGQVRRARPPDRPGTGPRSDVPGRGGRRRAGGAGTDLRDRTARRYGSARYREGDRTRRTFQPVHGRDLAGANLAAGRALDHGLRIREPALAVPAGRVEAWGCHDREEFLVRARSRNGRCQSPAMIDPTGSIVSTISASPYRSICRRMPAASL
jgi:pimeloyl-ACP methyl ester carboxylesterase